MNCHETFSSDLDMLHVKDKSKFRTFLQAGLFGRSEKQKYGQFDQTKLSSARSLVRFVGMVEQYTARNLTYDTDSLNAFTGIIRNFETAPTQLSRVFQIWGVPFCRYDSEEKTNNSFLDGLSWNHAETGPSSQHAEETHFQSRGDPSRQNSEQSATFQNQSPTMRHENIQTHSKNVQQPPCQQMGKPVPNSNGLDGQNLTMTALATDGATSSTFCSTEEMAAGALGAMRVPDNPNESTKVYNHHGHPRRRPGFPSWSWAGWAGGILYEKRSSYGTPRELRSEASLISVETLSRQKVSLSAYIDQSRAFDTAVPTAIHIQALALPASAFSYDTSAASSSLQVFNFPARLALSTAPWDASHFSQSLQNTHQRKCIYFGSLLKMVVIMVLEAQDESWSRVGLILLDEVWSWNFERSWKGFKMKSKEKRDEMRSRDIGEEMTLFRII